MLYSGIVSTSGTGNVTAISAPGSNQSNFFTGGYFWNSAGSPAGQFSIDNGSTWVDFDAGPFSIPLPGGNYASGVKVRRSQGTDSGAAESDVTGAHCYLY